ncbi:uncharacterized protein B0H64DRAFT_183857 [Chaetomium fimeti]|uniref:Uncharacterized protein n=1 Tax=Chaetomium fimeti TaxID=1854472 RepID=A0AAE0LRK4_9PEZI|nr:hypothetical protein B0H64DRAFT_183857 [Chaetomium fimeti]
MLDPADPSSGLGVMLGGMSLSHNPTSTTRSPSNLDLPGLRVSLSRLRLRLLSLPPSPIRTTEATLTITRQVRRGRNFRRGLRPGTRVSQSRTFKASQNRKSRMPPSQKWINRFLSLQGGDDDNIFGFSLPLVSSSIFGILFFTVLASSVGHHTHVFGGAGGTFLHLFIANEPRHRTADKNRMNIRASYLTGRRHLSLWSSYGQEARADTT